ncbi:MAG: hypothetical protein U0136_06600 [Bdellovibrionota bacterium]
MDPQTTSPNPSAAPGRAPASEPATASPAAPAAPRLATSPEQLMRAAITSIPPELADVRWHPADGQQQQSGRLLVHVRQMHAPSAADAATLPAEVKQTIDRFLPQARVDLESVLTRVTPPGAVFSLHLEGMDPRTAASYSANLKQLEAGKASAANLERAFGTKTAADSERLLEAVTAKVGPRPTQEQQRLLNAIGFLRDYQQLSEQVSSDPALKTVVSRGLTLVGAEDTKLHQDMLTYVRAHPDATVDDPRMAAMMDRRDAHTVDTIGRSGARTNLVVLGAGHDLRAEVDAWNKANPGSPMTLVEIDPRGVATYLREAQ